MLFEVDTVPMQVPGDNVNADAAAPPVFFTITDVPRVVSPGRSWPPLYRSVSQRVVPAAVLRHATVEASGPWVISIDAVLAVFVPFEMDAVYADTVPVVVSASTTDAMRPAATSRPVVRAGVRWTADECLPTTVLVRPRR